MEEIDRRAVMQLIRSIRVIGKDELHIEFNYQDEYKRPSHWRSKSRNRPQKGRQAKWQEKQETDGISHAGAVLICICGTVYPAFRGG